MTKEERLITAAVTLFTFDKESLIGIVQLVLLFIILWAVFR